MNNYSVLANDGDLSIDLLRKYMIDHGSGENIPYEWLLLNAMDNWDMPRDNNLGSTFKAFVEQFYPNFGWFMRDIDPNKTVRNELFFNHGHYLKMFGWGMLNYKPSPEMAPLVQDLLPYQNRFFKRALEFGGIVADFSIRFLGYVVILHDSKVILTSGNINDPRILPYVSEGYMIQKSDRIVYARENEDNPLAKKRFEVTEVVEGSREKSHLCL